MSTNRYFQLEEASLISDAEKIKIFTKHNPTIGSYRETILRKFISKFIPGGVKINTGFVSRNNNSSDLTEGQSKQIDLLIYNLNNYQPLLDTADFVVIRPESLIGAIEVKSNLTFFKSYKPNKSEKTDEKFPFGGHFEQAYRWSGTLIDALENIKACSDAYFSSSSKGYFSGILSYETNFLMSNFYDALDNNEIQHQLGINHLKQLPIAICIISKAIVVLSTHDMFEKERDHSSKFESFFNLIEATDDSKQFPLQFFITYIHNQTGFTYSERVPDTQGLYDPSGNHIRMWSHHFDLCSEDM